MKHITLICEALILSAAISSSAFAQRTSSAVQTVTFGVHRTSVAVLRNLSLVQSTVGSPAGSQAGNLQDAASSDRTKVTVAPLSMSAANRLSTTPYNTSTVESDVRSILLSKECSSLNHIPLIATITD